MAEDLPIIADTTEHEGMVTFGVVYNGAFVPLTAHKTGHIAQMVARFEGKDAPAVDTLESTALSGLEARVAALEASQGTSPPPSGATTPAQQS